MDQFGGNNPIWGAPRNDNLAEMITALTANFTFIRELLGRAGHAIGDDINRRVMQADQEFTRLQAQSLRQSMEQRRFREEQERLNRANRRRTASDSSTDTDNSDIDLDFYIPQDFTKIFADDEKDKPSTSSAKKASGETSQQAAETASSSSTAASSSTPATSTSSFLKASATKKAKRAAKKRKAAAAAEQAVPAKRSMATSTEDFYFRTQ